MMEPLPKEAVAELKVFVKLTKKYPQMLHMEELKFFKEFIESFGGTIPNVSSEEKPAPQPEAQPSKSNPSSDTESEEMYVELDNSGVIAPDSAEPLPDYDENIEVSEENIDKSNEKKQEAIVAYSDQEYEKAAQNYSEAIQLNPGSALLYAKRGQCYLQLNKPNACIRDCSRALLMNPDCAPAYKFRGRAHRLLGHWEQAAQDLRNACKIDFDEQADEWLREVTPNARNLEEHRLKKERKQREKELNERRERVRRAKEASEAVRNEAQGAPGNMPGGIFNSMPNMGPTDYLQMLNDPDLMELFRDPEMAEAFQDISKNPSNYVKYLDNPKVVSFITKLSSKYKGKFDGTTPAPKASDDTDLD